MTNQRSRLTRRLFGFLLALALPGALWAGNPVADWNQITIATALAGSPATAPGSASPAGLFVYPAYVHVAVYNAVNVIDGRFQPYGPPVPAPNGASKEAAVISAAYYTLLHYFPTQAAPLLSQYNASLAVIPLSLIHI